MKDREIILNLAQDFQCIGRDCPASCCSAKWAIIIDEATIQKWQQVEDEVTKEKLLKAYCFDEERGKHRMDTNEASECMLLTEDGYCSVQQQFGHSYLPTTCQKYPRVEKNMRFLSVSSMSLSCPEVTRLLVENDKKYKTVFKYKSVSKKNKKRNELQIDPAIAEILHPYVQECVNSEKYPPSVILLNIGKLLCEISNQSKSGELSLESLKQLTSSPAKAMLEVSEFLKSEDLETAKLAIGKVWKFILYFIPGVFEFLPVKGEQFEQVTKLFENKPETDEEYLELYNKLSGMKEKYHADLSARHIGIMKNYLKMKVVNNAFPWNPVHGNIIAGYLYCVIPYMLIQMLLWITKEYKGEINNQDLVDIIYRVERQLDHTTDIYEYFSENPELLHLEEYLLFLKDA